ncbi:hypothetical protein ACFX4S_14620 [Kosakonia sp. YIM B13605]|uniref:hypothetical protein n=1 Tax=Kosakonia TaxID=1330547 RepID=UPI0028A8460E|nr:hypothetical protein [Kosakonia sacchari]
MMKIKMLFVMLFASAVQMAHGQSDIQRNELEQAVIDFFKKSELVPGGCQSVKEILAKDPNNQQSKEMLIATCDSNIAFTKPVSFSEISQHEYAGDAYICGVISGETELGHRMGIRFISAEPNHFVIGFKFSRRPIVYIAKNPFTIGEYRREIDSFNKLNSEICL